MRSLLALCLISTTATAEPLLTAEEFNALTLGRTMTWAEYGQVYGVEQYLPGRRVRWTVLGDGCKLGHWYADGPAICFLYEDDPTPACWDITRSGSGLRAHDTGDPPGSEPVLIEDASAGLPCFGPEVGV